MGKLQLQKGSFIMTSSAITMVITAVVITLCAALYANHATISSLQSQLRNKDQIIAEKDNLIQSDAAAIGFRESLLKDQGNEINELKADLAQLQNAKQSELQKILDEQKKASEFKSGWTITFYSLNTESTGKRPGQPGYGLTASGARVEEGVTIACPKFIRLWTRIEIQGLGVRTCQDRGGGVIGNTLDVYIAEATEEKLSRLGRQPAKIRIIN